MKNVNVRHADWCKGGAKNLGLLYGIAGTKPVQMNVAKSIRHAKTHDQQASQRKAACDMHSGRMNPGGASKTKQVRV